jgi:hypothetical protein
MHTNWEWEIQAKAQSPMPSTSSRKMDLHLDLYCRRIRHRLDFGRDPTIPGNIFKFKYF